MNGHEVHEDIQIASLNGFSNDYPKPSAKALGKRRVVEPDNSSDRKHNSSLLDNHHADDCK